ncbi:MAG: DUF6894 family protein [Janthinobacterium lividum]
MARYYFALRNPDGFHHDKFGENFDSFEDARTQAKSILPDMAREELPDGDLHIITCNVRDEAGCIFYRGEIIYRGTVNPNPGDLDLASFSGTFS